MNYNVVGDIAGNYKTLMALLAQMPKDATLLSLGDVNDRGPRSKECIDFLMQNGITVQSNHGHMFVDYYRTKVNYQEPYYDPTVFIGNGGRYTLYSYGTTSLGFDDTKDNIPEAHIKWLETRPMFVRSKDFFFTHAPWKITHSLKQACEMGQGFYCGDYSSDGNLLWNRYVPERAHPRLHGKINVFGHNSAKLPKLYSHSYQKGIFVQSNAHFYDLINAEKIHGLCIDTSQAQVLTGLNTQTMTLYTQEYID